MTPKTARPLLRMLLLSAAALTFLLAACTPATGEQAAGPRDECGLIEPTSGDVDYALSFGQQAYPTADWIKSYTVEPYKISLTRTNGSLTGVAYLEYLIFNCGYGQTELNNYFNDESFNIIFGDYESHALTNFCEVEDLALYEYDLVEDGIGFHARYWAKQASDTRLLVMLLVFPTDTPNILDQYSQELFPEFPSCE
jgi:hypothetical protein